MINKHDFTGYLVLIVRDFLLKLVENLLQAIINSENPFERES